LHSDISQLSTMAFSLFLMAGLCKASSIRTSTTGGLLQLRCSHQRHAVNPKMRVIPRGDSVQRDRGSFIATPQKRLFLKHCDCCAPHPGQRFDNAKQAPRSVSARSSVAPAPQHRHPWTMGECSRRQHHPFPSLAPTASPGILVRC